MKKHIVSLAATAITLFLTGCLPEDFIWWSPDGQTAAIRTSEGLRLSDASGKLSEVVLPGEIQSTTWLPDNSGLVVSRSWKVKAWAAAEKLLPSEEAAATLQLARAIPDLLKAALTASGGSWEKMEDKFLKPLGLAESQALEPAWYCALNLYRPQILSVLASFTNSAALQAELLSSETNGLSIHELTFLSMGKGRTAGEPRTLIRSLYPASDPIVSPGNSALAFRTAAGALKCMTLDGKTSTDVADENVVSAVWSADGRALIYVLKSKEDKVGELRSRTVMTVTGELLQAPPQAQTLAMAAFIGNAPPRLAMLPDGRLLFPCVPVTLPAQAAHIHLQSQFFLVDPARPDVAPAPVQLTEGSLPEDLSAFALSPDGRFVAVVESGTDVVAVLELATGKVQIISPPHAGWKSRMTPAWRNANELTFAALPSAMAARPELNLWKSDAPVRVLSKQWPDAVVKPWLEAPAKTEQRAR